MQQWSRRRFLAAAATATLGVAGGGCGITSRSRPVGPAAKEVAAAEARRRRPGAPVREVTLTAAATTLDLAGLPVSLVGRSLRVPGADPARVGRLLADAGVQAEVASVAASFEETFVTLAA